MKPRMKIFLRQKKVTTQMIAKSLANVEYDIYKPTSTVSLHVADIFISGLNCYIGIQPKHLPCF
jgi:hypothetical protein